MKYFKNNNNQFFPLVREFDESLYEEVSLSEYEDFINNQENMKIQVTKALQYLAQTDHKDLPRYVPKEGEDMELLYRLRSEAREFTRANKNEIRTIQ